MKGYDEASHGLTCVLDGNLGGVSDHSSDFGCRFGFNSFLDYGAEFMCLDVSPIREVWALSGLVERKTADAYCKSMFREEQFPFHNLSTFLVSNDTFEGTILKSDVIKSDMMAARDSSILSVASNTDLCPHARQNRPRRVSMIPSMDSRATSLAFRKDGVLFCTGNGQACAGSALNKNRAEVTQGTAIGTNECGPLWTDELCVGSLPHDEEKKLSEENHVGFIASQTVSTDVYFPDSHLFVNKSSSFFEYAASVSNDLMCKKGAWMPIDKESLDTEDKEIEMLGKALCYAQTRARLAEKLAQQNMKERDKLEQLLIREQWTSHTYKQRAFSLEVENRLLKLYAKLGSGLPSSKKDALSLCVEAVKPIASSIMSICKEQPTSGNSRRHNKSSSSNDKKNNTRKGLSLSCALGFAFVLGLSIASTGIVIVWTVGWMIFS